MKLSQNNTRIDLDLLKVVICGKNINLNKNLTYLPEILNTSYVCYSLQFTGVVEWSEGAG